MIIRKAKATDAAGIARVHVDSWKTTYQGIVADSFLSRLNYRDRETWWAKILNNENISSLPFVAEDPSGKIVGFAKGGPARDPDLPFQGELYAIYILQSFQGKGIGKNLFQAVVQELQQVGFSSLYVWVLTQNPFKAFYETMGGKEIGTKPIEIDGKTLELVGYGWSKTTSIPDA